jgi:sulfur transporter
MRARVSAATTGIVAALLAVIAGSLLDVRPPDAYGICMACHARDLVNWTVNAAVGTRLTVAPASLVFPVLTPLGVLLGGLLAARTSGEFRWHRPDHPLKTFLYGVVVMNCALLAGGCSVRLLLRTAAGETLGIIGFGALAAGVIVGTHWLRWRAAR